MDDPIFGLLKRTGESTVDQILARVSVRPENVSTDLEILEEEGLITVEGPKTVNDFAQLVERVQNANGYSTYSKDEQRGCVLKEIFQHEPEFARTKVRLSTNGLMHALK